MTNTTKKTRTSLQGWANRMVRERQARGEVVTSIALGQTHEELDPILILTFEDGLSELITIPEKFIEKAKNLLG